MTQRARGWIEPAAVTVVALVGSAAIWGRLWLTSPSTRGVCGCGDPSLFQWFLAWPAHAITTGHSLVFSRDLFFPHGINLLANTSVLGLGVVLAPLTWLKGPVFTENAAALLAVPFAALAMDLLLRRLATSVPARVVLSLLFAFSPYVVASLTVSHLMTAWVGFLPLIVLGVIDATCEDTRRRRRGAWLLAVSIVCQFFISTELLVFAVIVAAIALAVLGATRLITRRPLGARAVARRLVAPLGAVVVVLAAPGAYALFGPESLHGEIWGSGFNPDTGGTSLSALVAPHALSGGLVLFSGYDGPAMVQMQYLGWGLLAAAVCITAWRWHDPIVRVCALTALVCLVLALSPSSVPWAPWQWIGRLPVLENVLQFRIVIFALLACVVIVARGVDAMAARGRVGAVAGIVALGIAVVPVAVPVAQGLPIRTMRIAAPAWWRHPTPGVVLSYPFADTLYQSALSYQARSGFTVRLVGGSGPEGTLFRAGADEAAESLLFNLSFYVAGRPTASAATAQLIRAMVARDGVTEVVVPVRLHGLPIITGAPSVGAAAFFDQVLGIEPHVVRGAWVFDVRGPLPPSRIVTGSAASACEVAHATTDPAGLGACLAASGAR